MNLGQSARLPLGRSRARRRGAEFGASNFMQLISCERVGERRPPACIRRQLADENPIKAFSASCRKGQAGSLRSPERKIRRGSVGGRCCQCISRAGGLNKGSLRSQESFLVRVENAN